MSRKLLSKLTLNSVNFESTGFGGLPGLSWQDVCFAMVGLSRVHHLFAQAVYSEDNQACRQLVGAIAKNYNQDYDFVAAALFEFTYPSRCGKCNDVKSISVCENCNGTGKVPTTDRQRAVLIGRSREYYRKRERVYFDLLELFYKLDYKLINQISSKLSNDAA